MNAAVVTGRQRSLDLQLLLQIRLKLRIDIVDDCLKRIVLVDLIAIADSVADGQLQTNGLLLQLISVRLELNIRQRMRTGHRLEAGVEQCVHQGGLAETRFTDAHDVEHEPILDALVDQLIGQTVEADMARQLHGAQSRIVSLLEKTI